MATTEQSTASEHPTAPGDFGANEWLVEDMYERYLDDPDSVDAAWHDFFADYRPGGGPASANGSDPAGPSGNGRTAGPSRRDQSRGNQELRRQARCHRRLRRRNRRPQGRQAQDQRRSDRREQDR